MTLLFYYLFLFPKASPKGPATRNAPATSFMLQIFMCDGIMVAIFLHQMAPFARLPFML